MGNKQWCVYVHRNRFNGKRYVGITSKEKPEHRWNSGRGYMENPHFYSAICKYGWDGFEHKILYFGFTEQQAKEAETRLISEWCTQNPEYGYNMTSGGDGAKGFHPSMETRAKLSEARKKENLSDETLRRRSESLRGRVLTDEHKKKIGDSNSKRISMRSKDGMDLRVFRSARDAESELGISHAHISQCCHGSRNSAGGYLWQFA